MPPESTADREVEDLLAKIGAEFGESYEPPPLVPDQQDLQSVEIEGEFLESERKKLVLRELKQNIKARKRFGRWAFRLMAIWIALVLLTVWMSAATMTLPSWYPSWLPTITNFSLSDPVLLVLIGSTTANIFGLLLIIFSYLFPRGGSKS